MYLQLKAMNRILMKLYLIYYLFICSILCQNVIEKRKAIATAYYEEAILHTLDLDINDLNKQISKEYSKDNIDNIILYKNHIESNLSTINKIPQYNKESIPFLRACVRLDPMNATYLNELIQTEEHCNITEKLDGHKQKLMKLLMNATTIDNNETKTLINIKHTMREIRYEDVHVLNNLNSKSYHKPFVIKNVIQSFNWNITLLTSLEKLKNDYPNEIVDFYPHNLIKKSSKKYTESLLNVIDFLSIPEGAYLSVDISEPGTYIQWNLDYQVYMNLIMNYTRNNSNNNHNNNNNVNCVTNNNNNNIYDDGDDDYYIPNLILNAYSNPLFFSNQSKYLKEFHSRTHWNMLLIGEEYSGMFLHYDVLPVGSWQIQLPGVKQWHLCDPLSTIASLKDIEDLAIDLNTIDLYHINYDTYPILKQLSCYDVLLSPGDLIYYAPSYLHQTLNIELNTISIALSGSVVSNEQLLITFIQNECNNNSNNDDNNNKKKYGFKFSNKLCLYIMNL